MDLEIIDETFRRVSRRFWHVIARTDDVVPGGLVPVTLLDEQLVLGRTIDGELLLLDDLCAHRGVRLSMGDLLPSGCVRCPYHGWQFDGEGRCTAIPQLDHDRIPATARVASHRVAEQAGMVWACLVGEDDEAGPMPVLPEADADGIDLFVGEPLDWACQSFREIENFCDVAHFSILHADTFGNGRAPVMPAYEVERAADGRTLSFEVGYPACDPFAEPDAEGYRPSFPSTFRYEVLAPFTVRLEGAAGPGTVMWIHSTPTSARSCRVFWDTAFPVSAGTDFAAHAEFEEKVWGPDRAIVEGQRPELLPLDLTEELHLPFDRFAVAYRRVLGDLGYLV
jgi:phenylpropionate dioxygenase-like ring-hydroxylating dioxygenase large terminal subunit